MSGRSIASVWSEHTWYDRVGNVLYQNNLVNPSESLLYHSNSTTSGDNNSAYGPLGREIAYSRGVLSASGHNGSSLDTVSYPSQTQSWSLDALGNWSSQTTSGVTTNRTFNAQNETTSVSGSTAPTYNNNGDTTSDNGDTYVYDAWDRLVAVKSGSTTIASYSYDALGRRITETYGSTTNNLYYSPQWQVIEERQGGTSNTNVTFQYVWGASYIDQMVFRDQYSGGVETQRLYSEFDANYDTTSLVNMSGSVVERYLYDPYGNMTVLTANWTPVSGNVSQSGWRFNFQGGRFDVSTGWYDFRNRDYIPTQGTWAERDPLGFGGGTSNFYQAFGSAPTCGTDATGLIDDENDPLGGLSDDEAAALIMAEAARQAAQAKIDGGYAFNHRELAPEEPPASASPDGVDSASGPWGSFYYHWIEGSWLYNIYQYGDPLLSMDSSQSHPNDAALHYGMQGANVVSVLADLAALGMQLFNGARAAWSGWKAGQAVNKGEKVINALKEAEDAARAGRAQGRICQTGARLTGSSADAAYDAIRASSSDVAAIARNTGFKAENIQKVKDHLFSQEHLLDRYVDQGVPAVMSRFDSSLEIANAWRRLEEGTHTAEDVQLLKHEMAESTLMDLWCDPSYTRAHDRAQQRYPAPSLE